MDNTAKRALRVRNLRKLMAGYETAQQFAEEAGVSASFLGQMLSSKVGTPSWRPCTEKTANKIERSLGLPEGWVSTDHEAEEAKADLAGSPMDMMGATLRMLEEMHSTSAAQTATITRLSRRADSHAAMLHVLIDALLRRDPALRPVLGSMSKRLKRLASEADEPYFAADLAELERVTDDERREPEDAMRAMLRQLVRSRGGKPG